MGEYLIVMHSAVRACPGYSRHEAPSILLDGNSLVRHTEHGRATTAQLTRRHGTIAEAIDAAAFALNAAELPKGIVRQARAAGEDYFYERLGLSPEYVLGAGQPMPGPGELAPEPVRRVLEEIVGFVVDGEYDELHDLSGGLLAVEDLQRRVEEDCPEALVLSPRESYRADAVSRSEDPDEPGRVYFLDLWTESGPAQLHIEGRLEATEGGFTATLTDIQP